MEQPIVESVAGFAARRPMVEYLERELIDQLYVAELGIPVNEDRPSPVLGAFVISAVLWGRRRLARRTERQESEGPVAIPRVFYGGHS
jgi:hypothetical protein